MTTIDTTAVEGGRDTEGETLLFIETGTAGNTEVDTAGGAGEVKLERAGGEGAGRTATAAGVEVVTADDEAESEPGKSVLIVDLSVLLDLAELLLSVLFVLFETGLAALIMSAAFFHGS